MIFFKAFTMVEHGISEFLDLGMDRFRRQFMQKNFAILGMVLVFERPVILDPKDQE